MVDYHLCSNAIVSENIQLWSNQYTAKDNITKSANELGIIDWDKELEGKDTNETFLCLKSRIEEQVSKHIPLSKSKNGHKFKPLYISQTALSKVKKKHQAYKRYLKTKNG